MPQEKRWKNRIINTKLNVYKIIEYVKNRHLTIIGLTNQSFNKKKNEARRSGIKKHHWENNSLKHGEEQNKKVKPHVNNE